MLPIDALIVPRGAEADAVERGWSAPRPAIVRVAAGAAAAANLDAAAFSSVLIMGLCGAVDPALNVGDRVVYADIVDDTGTLALDADLIALCAARLRAGRVRAAVVADVVGGVAEKRSVRDSTGSAVIDMEAGSLVRALQARGVRVAVVRVVSDDARTELPDLRGAFDAQGSLRPAALARAFVRTPGRSIRFVRHALAALARLREAAATLSAPASR